MYCPVAVTSHIIVSISVVRVCKFCASCNNMFFVFFCLIAHSAFTVSWLHHDVLLMIMCIEVLDLGLLLSSSVSPCMPELHNHARDFFYLLMIFQGPGRIVHALASSRVLLSSHFQCWN